jgi:hypothetical protein
LDIADGYVDRALYFLVGDLLLASVGADGAEEKTSKSLPRVRFASSLFEQLLFA